MGKKEKYLAKLIRAQLKQEEVPSLPEGVTVDEIVQIAKKHHLNYLLLGALIRVDNLTEEERSRLRAPLMNSILRCGVQVQEQRELERLFEEKGIINQPMKGAVLRFYYPAPQMREMSDLDILFAEQNMGEAQELLKERGYTLYRAVKHHDIFQKPPFLVIEAHRAMYDKTVDRQYVRAEVAGVVSSLKVAKGDEVTSGQEVAIIRDSSKMLLTLEFPAADAANFSVGQTAQVTLDGTFEQLDGTVTSVTGTDALSTGNLLTRTVTIAVQNAGGLTTAQAATASINGVSSIGSATFGYQAERTLTAQAAGTVTSIHVQEGQTVAENDILIELSGDDLTESIQSASETLRSAEISLQNLQDTMANYTVTSPISGTIIEKDAKVGDAVKSGDTLCVIYDLSYLEMVINVDELQISFLTVGQKVQITADAVQDKNYVGTVTRVSMKGTSNGGTTTYPVTIRIDETDGLRPGMNANAEIVVAEAANALTVPNAAIVRGGYVLVTQDSPSASKADTTMEAPEGFVYVAVKTGVSDDDYTQIVSGIQEGDTIGYDPNSVSSDSYYDDGSGMMIF